MLRVFHATPDLKALTKEGFVADMHFHSTHSHDCQTPIADIVKRARRLGIHLSLNDHNRISGVLEAQKHKDAPVIPAIEICTKEGKEVLPYFYDAGQLEEFYTKKLLKYLPSKNPLRTSATKVHMAELLLLLEGEQCVVHLPHPFAPQPRKSYPFFSRRPELLGHIHSIEAMNQTVTRKANLAALGWAVQLQKGVAGGSDGHALKWLGHCVTVSKATTVEEHLNAIKKGDVCIHGTELRTAQRMLDYAENSVRTKISRGLQKGLLLSTGAVEGP